MEETEKNFATLTFLTPKEERKEKKVLVENTERTEGKAQFVWRSFMKTAITLGKVQKKENTICY